MIHFADRQLYTFLDAAYLHGRDPVQVARALCEGGADIIQLRAKDWPVARVEEVAASLAPSLKEAGVVLVINDYPDIAQRVGADLCHLGQEDFFDAGHTQVADLWNLYPGLQIGLSTHAPDQAERAVAAAPAYIAIGPVYATDTKPSARPVTLDYVRWASTHVKIPWFAIGGINLENLAQVLSAGAQRICVVSAILNSVDVAKTCRTFKTALLGARR